jgi:hypothetical protein
LFANKPEYGSELAQMVKSTSSPTLSSLQKAESRIPKSNSSRYENTEAIFPTSSFSNVTNENSDSGVGSANGGNPLLNANSNSFNELAQLLSVVKLKSNSKLEDNPNLFKKLMKTLKIQKKK